MTIAMWVVGFLTAVSAVSVVFSRQTIYSALSLVATVGMLAVMYLLLNAQFLFVVQLIIYAGAVMVLFVFIIALLSPSDEDRPRLDLRMIAGIGGVLAITAVTLILALNGLTFSGNHFRGSDIGASTNPYHSFSFGFDDNKANSVDATGHGNIQTVAGQLFTTYLLPFEVTSMVLLVAVIGAVYLTRKAKQGAAT